MCQPFTNLKATSKCKLWLEFFPLQRPLGLHNGAKCFSCAEREFNILFCILLCFKEQTGRRRGRGGGMMCVCVEGYILFLLIITYGANTVMPSSTLGLSLSFTAGNTEKLSNLLSWVPLRSLLICYLQGC